MTCSAPRTRRAVIEAFSERSTWSIRVLTGGRARGVMGAAVLVDGHDLVEAHLLEKCVYELGCGRVPRHDAFVSAASV